MSEFRDEVDTHTCEEHLQKRPRSQEKISFNQQEGHYNLEPNELNLNYWFEMLDNAISDDDDTFLEDHNKEAMMDDNWSLDDEEALQVHPKIVVTPSRELGENWGDGHENTYSFVNLDDIQVDTEDMTDSTDDQMATFREEHTESFPILYSVVLPYTGISRHVKGAGIGLDIHGGISSDQGLVAAVTEVDYTGPGYIIGNLTAGCIIHKWNGIPLSNKTHEQTRGILRQRIVNSELNLLVCSNNTLELLDMSTVKKLSVTSQKADRSRRQSVISYSPQQEWVFEEKLIEERHASLVEIEAKEQYFGHVQLSILHNHSQLEVTLHQGKLSDSTPVDAVASITLIGEGLSNPDELLVSQTSISLSQTVNPVWNHRFKPLKLPQKPLSCTGLHLIIWDYKSDDQYKFIGEVFLNLPTVSRSAAASWYLLASRDPNLPQLATPEGVKKRATINKLFDRVLTTTRIAKSQDLPSLRNTSSKHSLLKKLKGITSRKTTKNDRMLVMRPKMSVLSESAPADCDANNSYHHQLPLSAAGRQLLESQQEDSLITNCLANERTMEVEAVVEPHTYQPAWGVETEVHSKPNRDLHGFEIRQEQLESPSSGYTSVHQSDTSSVNRNSGFSNYSSSSTESPDVMWHGVDETGIKCPTMIRRSCSMSSFPVMDTAEYQTIQEQYRKPSQASANSDQPMNNFSRLKPGNRSRSVEILIDTDSSIELSQTDASCSSQEEITTDALSTNQRPENLIMSFKMKYSAVQQPSAPQKSRVFFIKAKKIRAPFRLFRTKHASNSSRTNKSVSSSVSSMPSSPEGSKVCLTQQRKELGIGQFIPKLDHLQEPCGRIRFSLTQHRRLLLKIRTVEERSPTVSASDCCIKATLVQGKEVICKKKLSTTLNSATNPLAEMYLDSRGCTDKMHLHIVITKGSRLSKKYAGEVWVNMKWADLSGLSSWYQLYT